MNIQPLKKVTISILMGDSQEALDLTREPASFTYLHGIGPDGLAAFEKCLDAKGVGDTAKIAVTKEDAAAFFGHLAYPFLLCVGLLQFPTVLHLQLSVVEVLEASQREIVAALAHTVGHGGCGGGSCGCGCGSS